MNSHTSEPEVVPRAATLKFAWASGSRPLPGYTIKRGVGRGGFGEVYYAVTDAGKEVAIKLIRRNLDVELRGVTQCLNLKHPHLLALYDVKHDDEENCWVVMEYVAGESLEDLLARSPNGLAPQEAMEWIRGITAGVGYLHDHGIVHRDLKPGNIFCDEGVVKLGDYGLSKFISCSRRSGQTESIGTVHYMAPEVANGRYGREIDIYALGIVLYEMLTGRVPFEGESVGEVLMKHLTAEPDLSQLAEPYRAVIKRALAKDPEVRFGTVEELMAALPAVIAPPAFQTVRTANAVSPVEHAAAKPQPEIHATGSASDEDPVLQWVKMSLNDIGAYWQSLKLATPLKVLLALGAVILVARTANRILPILVWATIFYLTYRLVRAIWRRTTKSHSAHRTDRPFATGADLQVPSQPMKSVRHPVRQVRPAFVAKPPRERLTDLLGSLLVSALASMVISLVMVLLRGQPPEAAQYAWVTIVSTLGAWGVLIPACLWESRPNEPAMRRFVMLMVGLLLGTAAYAISAALWLELPFDIIMRPVDEKHIPKGFYHATSGAPLLFAYLVYFGFLFLLVRWWRSADPLRPTRLSLWATMTALFVAWLLNFVWPFPQPWGFMATATISLAVQLASPWEARREPSFRTANNI